MILGRRDCPLSVNEAVAYVSVVDDKTGLLEGRVVEVASMGWRLLV